MLKILAKVERRCPLNAHPKSPHLNYIYVYTIVIQNVS